jgi:hypothetical protein
VPLFDSVPSRCLETVLFNSCGRGITDGVIEAIVRTTCNALTNEGTSGGGGSGGSGSGGSLTHLSVASCGDLSDRFLGWLGWGAQRLRVLEMAWCPKVTADGMEALVDMGYGCTRLEQVDVSGCWGLGTGGLVNLVKFNQNLISLKMDYVRTCDDASAVVKELVANCPNLQVLSLAGHPTLTDEAVVALLKPRPRNFSSNSSSRSSSTKEKEKSDENQQQERTEQPASSSNTLMSNLRVLTLSSCEQLTDRSLHAIANWCPQLRELYLASTNVSNDGLASLARSTCRDKLTMLCLMRNGSVEDNAVTGLVAACPKLQTLRLAQSQRITPETVRLLRRMTTVVY